MVILTEIFSISKMNCAFIYQDRALVLPITYLETNGIPPSGNLDIDYSYDRTYPSSSASVRRLGVSVPRKATEGLFARLSWSVGSCTATISLSEALYYLYANLEHHSIHPLLDLRDPVYFEYQCEFKFRPDARVYVNQLGNDFPNFVDFAHGGTSSTSARKRTYYEMHENLGPSTPKERLIQRLTRIPNPEEYYGYEKPEL